MFTPSFNTSGGTVAGVAANRGGAAKGKPANGQDQREVVLAVKLVF